MGKSKSMIIWYMIFPIVVYGCESWTIKKAEHQRIDAFELWCWRRLLRVPWIKESHSFNLKGDQSWIFIGRTDAETPILWPPDRKSQLTGKDPDAGKEKAGEGDDRGWGGWMASQTQLTWVWVTSGIWWRIGKPGMLQSPGSQRVGPDWTSEQQLCIYVK